MNQDNYDYLKKQVKFTGFGDSLEQDLAANIKEQKPEFQLKHQHEFGKDQVEATLHFRKSDQNDMYFFNKYDLNMQKDGEQEKVQQSFYIGKENNYTLKEGYNLLAGRSVNKDLVNKEGEQYNAWVKLDFTDTEQNGNFKTKVFHENYGFHLDEALAKHPIKELANPEDKKQLTDSLQKGNRQAVTFSVDGKEEKRFIEAVPQFKSINVYDGSMKRIRQDQGQKASNGQSQSSKQEQAKGKKAGASGDDDEPGTVGQQQQKPKRKQQKL